MKTSVLLYSRDCHQTSEILAYNLSHAGYQVEQTYLMNLPRIALNPYLIVHFLIQQLPLTANELLCLKVAQTLGRIVVLTIIDSNQHTDGFQLQLFRPDGFTVSQTDHLQYFRKWSSFRMVLPNLPDLQTEPQKPSDQYTEDSSQQLYLFLFSSDFSQAINFNCGYKTYFDGRYLLKDHSAASLRKKWQSLIKEGKISKNQHLVLSTEKTKELFRTQNIAVALNHPYFLNHELTPWIELATRYKRFVVLNEHQAAGFNQYWTSGQNCLVVSEAEGLSDLSEFCSKQIANQQHSPWAYTEIASSKLYDPLTNELSRLYTKILHQKTRLLPADSANI